MRQQWTQLSSAWLPNSRLMMLAQSCSHWPSHLRMQQQHQQEKHLRHPHQQQQRRWHLQQQTAPLQARHLRQQQAAAAVVAGLASPSQPPRPAL
jgi:hypothetical protein